MYDKCGRMFSIPSDCAQVGSDSEWFALVFHQVARDDGREGGLAISDMLLLYRICAIVVVLLSS